MLVIGKKRYKNSPTKIGGAIVLFEQLLTDLTRLNVNYEVVDTNYRNYGNKIWGGISIYCLILRKGKKHDKIFINGSNNFILLYWFPIWVLKILYRKKLLLRFFGGNFDTYFKSKNKFLKHLIYKHLSSASLIFFEQKYQLPKFKSINNNIYWFPNVRYVANREKYLDRPNHQFMGKFIFIGHVRQEKGIDEILAVKKRLGAKFSIQLFGPLISYSPPKGLEEVFKSIYKRPLNPEEVLLKLKQNDVLILPSYKEGYPGIVIEALAVGIPVIVSQLPSVEEMLSGKEGFFIKPKDIQSLQGAVLRFNSENYKYFSREARDRFSIFDSSKQMPRILKIIENC